ncbi:malectin domain-containing carbohydrate-binding protein [Halomonas sp. WWR20]
MVTNNFSKSSLDLNGKVSLNMPTALDWGEDGRLYVTEVSGEVKVLTVAFGDSDPNDGDSTASFYVTEAETISSIKNIPNHNDDGSSSGSNSREVTGIDVTPQYDENGAPVLINGKPAVTVYVTSSDSRIGAGNGGEDTGLDTNSGIITRLTQTADGWEVVDLVRGLARSEENHALNGLEVIQELDDNGQLVSERIIVANGGNANAGAPSNNFSGQQETAYSGAILEVDLDQLKTMAIKSDNGRDYIYDVPTLDDPSRAGVGDNNDPFGGNDGFNAGKLDPDGPVQIYSPGYRNAYDVEVTEDGRVWTYDNGANNSWGGRPIGEAGDNGGTVDYAQDAGYIPTNLNNGDGNSSDTLNLESGWNPKNYDQFHEITRSDDLAGRILSAGQGGAATYTMTHPDFDEPLTLVYGGHPNPTRASGGEAGLLFTPKSGVEDAFLLVAEAHYDSVIDWFTDVENQSGGVGSGALTSRVIGVVPGELYYITEDGSAYLVDENPGNPSSIQGSTVLGKSGIPSDLDEVVATLNPIEGNYLEGGYTDGAIDSGLGSINGLTEYTSTVFDTNGVKMSGAILASQYNGGDLIVMGRDENGVMQTVNGSGATKAADRITLELTGSPLGLTSIGDDLSAWDNQAAFRGSVWASVYSGSGTKIEILQPNNGAVPLAGSEVSDPSDHDLDGVDNIHDPFEYSATNGLELTPDKAIVLNFQPTEAPYPGTLSDTGLMGAALDGSTPNQDANPAQGTPGLFDNGGNIIPGANAPIFQIKNVVPGSVVGAENGVRDAMHVGVNPSDDVQRLVATTQVQNWIPTAGGVEDGQLTGIMFGDGTQANFVRLVFGEVNGQPGFEVGYEIDDSNYQALAQVALPALADNGTTEVELRLEIYMANGFALGASYRLTGQSEFTQLPLNGFSLPDGVLQNVLTGAHTISDGDTQLSSGAAFGFLAETSEGAPLAPVNFNNLNIQGFGNEIGASTAESVGAVGSGGVDTILYTGTDAQLAPLDGSVENFDGSGSSADFHATGNSGANVMIAGSGDNTFTGGGGADRFQGTLETLDGTEITDFSADDEIMVQGASFDASDVTYQAGSAIITINGETAITFSGEGFADFDPDSGASLFMFTSTANGTRITTTPALTPVAAISSGGPDITGVTVRDQQVDFLSDMTNAEVNGWVSGVASKNYVNMVDVDASVPDALHQSERSAVDSGEWGYSIPVENGDYLIDLYFAEIFHGVENGKGTGARVFDISVEDTLVEDDYDIIGDVGSAAAEVIKTYAVTVTDGVLDIGFDASVNQAKISGLSVWKVEGTYVPSEDATPPEVVSITLDQPLDNDSAILATVMVTDNAGIDVSSITGNELIFTGYEPGNVSLATGSDAITLSSDGKTATIQYLLSPPSDSNAWSSGTFQVGVAAGSYTDTAGLGVAAYETDAFIVTNLDSLVKGALQRAINVGPTSDSVDNGLEGDDKRTYGGAIADDPILGIDLEADDPSYYSPATKAGSNIDGKAGTTGSNSGGIDLDGSAYHTYRDSSAGSYTATYEVPNGVYVVELHFAELYQSQAGQRQGDYTIQGEALAENFDAFTQAGGADKPVVLTKNVVVTDGKIVIGVSADTGQPGFNAIAIYRAVDGDMPVASILSIDTPESSDGQVVVTVRYTDDEEIAQAQIDASDVTVSSAASGAPVSPSLVAYDSASGIATYAFDAPDGGWQTGTITATVAANAVLDGDDNGNGATASSVYANFSSDGVILELDFENPGSPLEEGGFDGTLGSVSDDSVVTSIENGELVVWTSNGDISQAANPSANDFVKHVALGNESLNEINISSRFDNPFPEALAAQELDTSTIPNWAQQGIVFGLGSQNSDELVKLVFGGNGGTAVQIWSKGSINTVFDLEELLSDASTGLTDIAAVELTLSIDKAAGTVTPIVTFLAANDAVLGGLRAEPTEGFATAAAETLPAAVLANLTDPSGQTAVGVTSTDYINPVGSFKASWEYLNVTSPDLAESPDPQITIAIADAEPVVESGDNGSTALSFGLTASDNFSGEVNLELTLDGTAETRAVSFSEGVGTLTVEVPNDDQANGPDNVSVILTGVSDTAFAIDAEADTATGSVTEDDDVASTTNDLEFNDGDTLAALFDGVTDGSGTDAEETGTATIAGGNLVIEVTDGDAGGGNDANDNYYTNVSGGGGFSASLKFGNPFPTLPAQYSQLGMNVSLSQNEYLKVTFGNAGGGQQIEYSYENGGVQTKQTFALPSGVSFAQIADVVIALKANVDDDTASFSGSMTFLDASGKALGSTSLPALDLPDGPLNTAITTEGATFGVGVTQTSFGSGPSFDASYDYLRIQQSGGEAPEDPASEDDIDGDGIANQNDDDIDGDGITNGDDVFAYDADDGQPLTDGETLRLDFNVDGTPYQNGFTGVMASSNPAFKEEDTGAGVVESGQLRVTTTSGDTGSANTPQNDYQLGIVRDGGFKLETVVDNPFTTAPGSYSQLGIAISVNSNDFAKLVFGSVGQDIEFSTRDSNVEAKLGADFPGSYGFTDFAKAKLVMDVVVDSSGNATANATITLLNGDGAALSNDASVTINGLDLTGVLEEAIIDPAASVGVGVTHTHGTATPFTAAYDYFEVTATEVDDDTATPPVPATQIEEIFAAADLDLSDTYGQGDVGSALVTVTADNNDVQESNYGSDSFKVQNTGDKKIAAVFFDVTTALYGDSVFDPDGKGGDTAFKEWAIDSDGNTGAIQPSGYEHYFLPGTDPDPVNSDNNGGFRGALVKFSADADGGFTHGEVVGFSGDMDPNSIAGFDKSGAAGVDTGSVPAWDVGGVSGAELIGSNVYIKFTDGSTASGQLMSDGSQAGAQVRITEAPQNLTAELTVNGLASGAVGSYGGTVPSVVVSGPAGEWVRVVMTKGHQPVANNQNGLAETVEERLADKDFPANNAAEFQIVDVQLGTDGSADISGEFTYDEFLNGTAGFAGDDTLPLGFVAAVIDNPNTSDGLARGPVSQPVYLVSNGDTDPFVNNPIDDQTIEAGAEFSFTVPDDVFTDLDGDALTYEALDLPAGIAFDAETRTFSGTPAAGVGSYPLQVRVTDEDGAAATATFDLVVEPEAGDSDGATFVATVQNASGDIEQGSSVTSADLEIGSYVAGLQFTVPDDIELGSGATIDSAIVSWVSDRTHSSNAALTFSVENTLDGAGFGSVTSRTYLAEQEMWQTSGTWQDGETITAGVDLADQLNALIAQGGLVAGDVITVKVEGAGGTRYVEAAGGGRTAPSLAIKVGDSGNGDGGNDGNDDGPAADLLTFAVFDEQTDAQLDGDLEDGDTLVLSDPGEDLRFSGALNTPNSAYSISLQLLDDNDQTVGSQIENIAPYDLIYTGEDLVPGDYTLNATVYAQSGASGSVIGTQSIDFTIGSDTPGDGDDDQDGTQSGIATGIVTGEAFDAEQKPGASIQINSSDLEVTSSGGAQTNTTGAVFTLADSIAANASVSEAKLVFSADPRPMSNFDTGAITVQIESTDEADSYAETGTLIGRDYLAQMTTTPILNGESFEVDVTSLVQQLMDQVDLDAGDTIGFRLSSQDASYYFQAAETGNPAEIAIEWSSPANADVGLVGVNLATLEGAL